MTRLCHHNEDRDFRKPSHHVALHPRGHAMQAPARLVTSTTVCWPKSQTSSTRSSLPILYAPECSFFSPRSFNRRERSTPPFRFGSVAGRPERARNIDHKRLRGGPLLISPVHLQKHRTLRHAYLVPTCRCSPSLRARARGSRALPSVSTRSGSETTSMPQLRRVMAASRSMNTCHCRHLRDDSSVKADRRYERP